MKKNYEKPVIYSEDVSIAFVQTCCQDIYISPHAFFGGFCVAQGCKTNPTAYAQAG